MNLTELVMQVRAMKGLMPEPNRTVIAARLATMLTKSVEDRHGKTSAEIEAWNERGLPRFMTECRLTAPMPDAPLTDQTAVDLAGFIKRWRMIDGWRPMDASEGDHWRDFSEEQNLIRHTMLRELRLIMEGHILPAVPDKKG